MPKIRITVQLIGHRAYVFFNTSHNITWPGRRFILDSLSTGNASKYEGDMLDGERRLFAVNYT